MAADDCARFWVGQPASSSNINKRAGLHVKSYRILGWVFSCQAPCFVDRLSVTIMADLQESTKVADMQQNYNAVVSSNDPKNMQELTQFVSNKHFITMIFYRWNFLQVQTLLQQMQDRFQTMSDQIITRNILL